MFSFIFWRVSNILGLRGVGGCGIYLGYEGGNYFIIYNVLVFWKMNVVFLYVLVL